MEQRAVVRAQMQPRKVLSRCDPAAEFEATAARVSGQDLAAFFTAWLRTPARPAATADNGLG